jgi:hypothetical protein
MARKYSGLEYARQTFSPHFPQRSFRERVAGSRPGKARKQINQLSSLIF